jgi:hypothetical protein
LEKDKKIVKKLRKYCLLAQLEDKKTKRSDKRRKTSTENGKRFTKFGRKSLFLKSRLINAPISIVDKMSVFANG